MNPPYLACTLLFVGIDDPLDLVDFLSGEGLSPREGCDKAWQGAGKSPLDYFCALCGLHFLFGDERCHNCPLGFQDSALGEASDHGICS